MKDFVATFLLYAWCRYQIPFPIKLSIETHPHMLITGSSGSGKSKSLLFMIGKLVQAVPDIEIYICDFKNSEDFAFLKGYGHYYAGKDCYSGVIDYYALFSERREQDSVPRTHSLLIFDEYPAFVNYLQMQDKINKTKYAGNVLSAVSEILMLGRGIRCGIWVVTQRADSALFANGGRDNFMAYLALGNLSKEQKGMIFPGEEIPIHTFQPGEGMLLADGQEIVAVKFPIVDDMEDWKQHILHVVSQE